MLRYVHTNIIARDAAKLIAFYKETLGCKSIGQTRDLRGPWLDAQIVRLTAFLGEDRAHEFVDLLVGSPADAIETALDVVEQGSSERTLPYLRAHGMTDAEVTALEERLLG